MISAFDDLHLQCHHAVKAADGRLLIVCPVNNTILALTASSTFTSKLACFAEETFTL